MSGFLVVLKKEILDNLRDKRSVMAALFYPLLGPVLLVGLLSVVGSQTRERFDKSLEVPIVGAEQATDLVAFLARQDIHAAAEVPEDVRAAVKNGDLDVAIEIDEDFAKDLGAGRPATVRLIVDETRQPAEVAIRRTRDALRAYGSQIGSLRLLARGIDPGIVGAVAVDEVSVATEQSRAAMILSMAPYFIILSLFIGGMYLAIDSTAGERERGSLEPLLLNPISRSSLVLGKYAAVQVFTALALLETLLAFWVLLNFAPLEKWIGMKMHLSVGALLGTLAVSLPIALLAGAIQMLVATLTKSFKEAQNYLSFLPLIPALPGMFLAFVPVKPAIWHMLIPTFGQQLLINRLLRGEGIDWSHAVIASVATAVVAGALLMVTIDRYRRESLVFGK
jgi:sodium transport system permease protein